MKQNNMLAMILAGGRGTRLLELTKKNAKPAFLFQVGMEEILKKFVMERDAWEAIMFGGSVSEPLYF